MKMTKEEKIVKENGEKTKKYIDKVHQSIKKLLDSDEPQLHQMDKSYFIGWAIARNQSSDLNLIWALESIIDAFNNEQDEYDKLKSESKSRLLDKIKIFKNTLSDDTKLSEIQKLQ
tara:strand:- start:485 stop:832 length:348 start_codon:yes stop_codon:yes gene_type:complete